MPARGPLIKHILLQSTALGSSGTLSLLPDCPILLQSNDHEKTVIPAGGVLAPIIGNGGIVSPFKRAGPGLLPILRRRVLREGNLSGPINALRADQRTIYAGECE